MDGVVQHLLRYVSEQNVKELVPICDEENPIESTEGMRTWYTSKPNFPATKSHISHVVGDSSWEGYVANVFEKSEHIVSYAKNDHLGFQVFYLWSGSKRKYLPDFLLKLKNGKYLVVEIKGKDSPQNKAKRDALSHWCHAISTVGGFGIWCWDVAFQPSDIHDIVAKHAA